MEKDILGGVIEVEKEIQERLKNEKKKSQEWLENEKRDAEKQLPLEETALKEAFQKAVEDAKLNAEHKASEVVNKAHADAEMLKGIRDETLKKIVSRHLHRILPGY